MARLVADSLNPCPKNIQAATLCDSPEDVDQFG